MHWVGVPGTSDAETVRTTTAVSQELRAIPGVRSFGAHIGQALLGEEVFGVNFGENWISLDPSADYDQDPRARSRTSPRQYPGLFREVQTYLDERIEEVLTGGKEPIIIRVYGEDLGVLRDEVRRRSSTILAGDPRRRRTRTPTSRRTSRRSRWRSTLDKAEKYGLKPGDVRRAAATLVAGEEVGDIFRAGRAYDVVVWSTPATRTSVTPVQQPADRHALRAARCG